MKNKWMRGLIISLVLATVSKMEAYQICDFGSGSFDVNAGYRCDNLRWSIQGLNGTPNILSELTFRDLRIFQIGIEGDFVSCDDIYFRGKLDYGWILSGRTQDSDYNGNDRTLEFSRSYLSNANDSVFDGLIGIGYLFDVCNTGFTIASIVGYSFHEQDLRLSDGIQVIDTVNPENEGASLSGLNSTYKAFWNSGWIGIDLAYQATCDLSFFANYEHHIAFFHGKGNWNLRSDIIGDFIHEAINGHGDVITIGGSYLLCDGWSLGLQGNYQYWRTHSGAETITVEEQGVIVTGQTGLNPVLWRSYALLVDLGYQF